MITESELTQMGMVPKLEDVARLVKEVRELRGRLEIQLTPVFESLESAREIIADQLYQLNPNRYEITVHWEGKLLCENPREEAIKKGIPCILCGQFMATYGCSNENCEVFVND